MDVSELHAAYIEGASVYELAPKFGCSASKVQMLLKGMDGYPRKRRRIPSDPDAAARHAQKWLREYVGGMSLQQVADANGVAVSTVHYTICELPGYESGIRNHRRK